MAGEDVAQRGLRHDAVRARGPAGDARDRACRGRERERDGDDVVAIRSVCYLPLTYDHRIIDGADAGRFVSAIKARLEEGAFEADLGL